MGGDARTAGDIVKYPETTGAEPMLVTLDLQEIRSSMALWRDTLVLCQPEAQRSSEMRVIQVKMLKDLDRTLTGWLDLLKMCKAQGPHTIQLQNIRAEVAEHKAWAEEALAALTLTDSVQRLHRADQQA